MVLCKNIQKVWRMRADKALIKCIRRLYPIANHFLPCRVQIHLWLIDRQQCFVFSIGMLISRFNINPFNVPSDTSDRSYCSP